MTTKGMNTISRATFDQVMTPNYAPISILPERGEGARLWDSEGNCYLDFAAGIAVSALGHAHPELVKVLTEQAHKYWHVSNILVNQPALRLASQLCDITFAERVFLGNSGAEANEAAFKLARRYAFDRHNADKAEIIAFDNSFHGRTFFTVCVGGQSKYSDGFGPKPGAITHLPFNDVAALTAAVGKQTCAVVLELIQGEGGINPASIEFVNTARRLCDQHDALLIFDEIQTGVGRTGSLYLYQQLDVTPDILTSAKGLGGGMPIAAMLTTAKIAHSLAVGTHGSTYGGNPLACAVADKVLTLVNTPQMLNSIKAKGQHLQAGLSELGARYNLFEQVRGEGLLIGCELKCHWHDRARDILQAAQQELLLILVAGSNVLRLAPPLIINHADIDEGLKRLDRAVRAIAAHSV